MVDLLQSRDEGPGSAIVPATDEDGPAESGELDPCLALHGLRNCSCIHLPVWETRYDVFKSYNRHALRLGGSDGHWLLPVDGICGRCGSGILGEGGQWEIHDVVGLKIRPLAFMGAVSVRPLILVLSGSGRRTLICWRLNEAHMTPRCLRGLPRAI